MGSWFLNNLASFAVPVGSVGAERIHGSDEVSVARIR